MEKNPHTPCAKFGFKKRCLLELRFEHQDTQELKEGAADAQQLDQQRHCYTKISCMSCRIIYILCCTCVYNIVRLCITKEFMNNIKTLWEKNTDEVVQIEPKGVGFVHALIKRDVWFFFSLQIIAARSSRKEW